MHMRRAPFWGTAFLIGHYAVIDTPTVPDNPAMNLSGHAPSAGIPIYLN